jgi:hypothetical protein
MCIECVRVRVRGVVCKHCVRVVCVSVERIVRSAFAWGANRRTERRNMACMRVRINIITRQRRRGRGHGERGVALCCHCCAEARSGMETGDRRQETGQGANDLPTDLCCAEAQPQAPLNPHIESEIHFLVCCAVIVADCAIFPASETHKSENKLGL